jgi:chitinase
MLIISNGFSASIQGIHNSGTGVLLHNVQVQHCPQACEFAGADTATWTTYHGFDELSLCDDTVLFTFNVHATTSDSLFKACSTATTGPRMQAGAYHGLVDNNITDAPTPDLIRQTISPDQSGILSTSSHNGSCGALPQQTTLQMDTRWSGTGTSSSNHVSIALSHLESYFRNSVGCGKALIFARSSVDVVVGAFVGGDVAKSTAADLLGDQAEILSKSFQGNLPARYAALTANPSSGNDSAFRTFFDTRFALSMDTSGDLSSVQTFFLDYIVNLNRGADFQQLGGAGSSKEVSVTVLASAVSSNVTVSSHQIEARALCRDIQVVKDDICPTLATKCGISGADFTKYNSKTPNLCSTLKANQYVCCSSGDLPDHTPQPGSDGICASYQVQPLDGCKVIADSFGINITRILEVNQRTWGFRGCGDGMLQKGQIICVSKGDPPMPAQDPTAICGPQVVGSQRPSSWNDVAKLNPCLLNACCDAWGQCGTTKEFCTISNIGGVPGTAEPGTNGCISKCGTEIVGNNDPPTTFARVGYFEGFNNERECLNMDITQMNLKKYTHVHFAFATISNVYTVSMTDAVKEQFEKMVQLDAQGAKKILSFGGWSFSTAHDTSPIFAQGVSSANRELFASNVVQFLIDKKLDGLDFDWEYPGATDIEGATPGSPQDGLNYYKFLQSVKNKLPSGKTLSIALPASYWVSNVSLRTACRALLTLCPVV